jgi:hypothetical protein
MIDREMFEEWLAHPVTEHVLKHFAALSEERRDRWMQISWAGGDADPFSLKVLRETAALLIQMSELKYEDIQSDEE